MDLGGEIMEDENAEYGEVFVQKLADFFAQNYPNLKGFNRRGLYRMKQFYELYKDNKKVSTLLTQLSWSNHLKIMSACKNMEERIFYMNMCVRKKYSARELARQIDYGCVLICQVNQEINDGLIVPRWAAWRCKRAYT